MKKLLSALLSFTTLFTFTTADLPEDYSAAADSPSSSYEFATIPADGEYEVMAAAYGIPTYLQPFDQGDGNILFPYDASSLTSDYRSLLEEFLSIYDPTYYDYCLWFSSSSSSSFYMFFYEKSDKSPIDLVTYSHSSGICKSNYYFYAAHYFFSFKYDSSSNVFTLSVFGSAPVDVTASNSSGTRLFYCYGSFGSSSHSNRRFFFSNPEDAVISSQITSRLFDAASVRFYDINAPEQSTHTLTINYLYSEDNPAAEPVTRELFEGEVYSIPSPEIEGYTPSIPLVTGTMPNEDLTIDVYYTKAFYSLTVKYQYQDGRKAADDVTFQYPMGFAYDIQSPEIEGYTADKPTVSGTMPGMALEEVVTYTPTPYTLSIFYQYENGTQAAAIHREQLTKGAAYSVTSPTITGYKPDQEVISGTMSAKDVYFTVTYKPNSSGGSSSGGSSGGGEGEGDGDGDGDDDNKGGGSSGGGSSESGGGWTGNDPFIPSQPPFSGYDPFDMPSYLPDWNNCPFHVRELPGYTYDPFVMPGG